MNRRPTDRLIFLIEFLDLAEATGDPKAKWEWYQLQFLNNRSILSCDIKSRQVGWSFTAAAEAVAEAVLTPRSTVIFVSVTQVEAAEKVRYANYCIEALDPEVRPTKLINNRTEIELGNGSRIVSHPCRPPRGKARARVYLDEFAHYPRDEEIYTAAVPIITRGGVIRIGSSPLGAQGLFWEIFTEAIQAYPGYDRMTVPWWTVDHLCKDPKAAWVEAPSLGTVERVYHFGSERLIHIFENMPLEDFQQEYECDWSDESVAWITWEEVKRNQVDAQLGVLFCKTVQINKNNVIDAEIVIKEVADAIKSGEIGGELVAGMDVGRKKNLSELVFLALPARGAQDQWPLHLGISMDRLEFDDQKHIMRLCLDQLPVRRMLVDDMGIGMQLAEDMVNEYPTKVDGFTFTNESKAEMAVNVKLRMQKGLSPIPLDRSYAYQFHSIKRMVTPGKRLVFDTARNEKHHADKFWAFALAHEASIETFDVGVGANPLTGYRG